MPKFDVSVPNLLGREAALEKLQGFSAKIQEQHADKIKDIEQRWEGDDLHFGFKTLGLRISGKLMVEESVVRVEGDLPFAAAMFKGQITGAIQGQLERLLR
ncbi:putative polyhydroxyalkanoic acid system protein [Botrimarina colliarenosi]|uniref:Putative polyhydroxyalkanoic acid system protein n=1 Tax=Botrimarina colliarenosi TaxID=2528001 RepID=A0A5C6AD46_9BACT|nr:polyhydroxyalkanoic acid system family protein [Botrimarina colliarenosi]TWT96173.1 putative polyhydroxyalkanoic acid system protein [Botrimarina colliarenosi]